MPQMTTDESIEAPVQEGFYLKEILLLSQTGLSQFASQTLCDGESVRNFLLDIHNSALNGINNHSNN